MTRRMPLGPCTPDAPRPPVRARTVPRGSTDKPTEIVSSGSGFPIPSGYGLGGARQSARMRIGASLPFQRVATGARCGHTEFHLTPLIVKKINDLTMQKREQLGRISASPQPDATRKKGGRTQTRGACNWVPWLVRLDTPAPGCDRNRRRGVAQDEGGLAGGLFGDPHA